MNLKELERLLQLVQGTDVEELEIQRGEETLRIRRRLRAQGTAYRVENRTAAVVPPDQEPDGATAAPAVGTVIHSPLVGTFYRAPTPEAKTFVEVGDTVVKGQVLCIVEAMKLMNEIDTEIDGKILTIFATNGQPVEYGQPLFEIEPA